MRDITFVRESPMGRFADQSRAGADMFESVGTIEELAVSLLQQARIYLADLPRHLRGEVDLLRLDMLSPENVASMQRDLHVSATAADRSRRAPKAFRRSSRRSDKSSWTN